jgi:hypothetical protein
MINFLERSANAHTCAREDLLDIFNPVIDDILKLVDDQVERVKMKMGGRGPKVWHHTH